MKNTLILILACLGFWSCEPERKDTKGKSKIVVRSDLVLQLTSDASKIYFGDSLQVKVFSKKGNAGMLHSIHWNDLELKADSSLPQIVTIPVVQNLGKNVISASAVIDGKEEKTSIYVTVLSDIQPINTTYDLVNSYPHDQNAYTQGFVINDGIWYEGTGGQGVSDIRIVEKSNGEILLNHELEDRHFGEGITYHKDKVYQLTWKSQTGFEYDPKQLVKEREFYYIGEGWGLTSDSNYLIKSDGSNKLTYLDDKNWAAIKTLHVYDDKGPVNNLNELEYIDGKIWSNVWQREYIVVIDPETGKVLERIKLKGLLNRSKYRNAEVLNGIAWDADARQLFVTGKYWPYIFQIKIIPDNA